MAKIEFHFIFLFSRTVKNLEKKYVFHFQYFIISLLNFCFKYGMISLDSISVGFFALIIQNKAVNS
jgi:hypothetical protein